MPGTLFRFLCVAHIDAVCVCVNVILTPPKSPSLDNHPGVPIVTPDSPVEFSSTDIPVLDDEIQPLSYPETPANSSDNSVHPPPATPAVASPACFGPFSGKAKGIISVSCSSAEVDSPISALVSDSSEDVVSYVGVRLTPLLGDFDLDNRDLVFAFEAFERPLVGDGLSADSAVGGQIF